MTDSSSFSSLMALVESHLSKTNIEENNADHNMPPGQSGTMSDTRLSFMRNHRLPMPSLGVSEGSIQTVLAQQVSNMLKAKELKKQQEEEKQRLADEMKKLQLEENEDDCVIDLMQALQTPYGPGPPPKEPEMSGSSSFESLFEPKFIDCDDIAENVKSPEPLLPCKTDMSYILYEKIPRGKCSAFGRVLTSRWKPVVRPYVPQRFPSTIVPFDFSTPSPCDILKEKQRKPTTYCQYQPDIMNFV